MVSTILIALTDAEVDFIQILFEVVSAFATVGLRLGSRQVYQYLLSWSYCYNVRGTVGVLLLMSALLGDPALAHPLSRGELTCG